MKYSQKFYLVPPEIYDSMSKAQHMSVDMEQKPEHNGKPVEQPSSKDVFLHPNVKMVYELDKDMKSILQDNLLTDYEKVERYNQKLQQYLNNYQRVVKKPTPENDRGINVKDFDQATAPVTPEPTLRNLEVDSVLSSIPKSYQSKAKTLLKFINDSSEVSYNSSGEVFYKGDEIPGVNLTGLVNNLVRKRKPVETYNRIIDILSGEGFNVRKQALAPTKRTKIPVLSTRTTKKKNIKSHDHLATKPKWLKLA